MADCSAARRGGRYCVAGAPNNISCMNTTFTPGIRMHQFPSNPVLRRKWVKFVQRHRKNFCEPLSKYTSLCSAHFDETCYGRRYSDLMTKGNDMHMVLRKSSIPTRDAVTSKGSEIITKRQKRKVCLDFSHLRLSWCRLDI